MRVDKSQLVVVVACFRLILWLGCESTECPARRSATDGNGSRDAGGADSDADSGPGGAHGEPITPDLDSISAADAERLGAYARRLRCSSAGNRSRPVAWSMVNVSCQDRAMALAYAVAAADTGLIGAPSPMVDSEMTVERINELAEQPSFDAAMINVAGPLVTNQVLVGPDGQSIDARPLQYYWAYHHGVVVNVEGEIRVLDLSVGDAPVRIGDWLAGFVEPSITCRHSSDEVHQKVWVYWNSAFSNFELPDPPPVSCAYTVTPIFTWRRDQVPSDLAEFIAFVPSSMDTLLDSLQTTLLAQYGVSLADDELANVTSHYSPGTTEDVCTWARMQFCDQL